MRVLNRVWENVERAMAELRKVLLSQLLDPVKGAEEQDKALETLLEIHSSEDPMWTYFDLHHTHIMNDLTGSYRTSIKPIDRSLRTPSLVELTQGVNEILKVELQAAVLELEVKRTDTLIAKSSAEPTWNSIYDLVKCVSEVLGSSLPNFWRISKDFIDGKYKKHVDSVPGTRRSPSQCKAMAFDTIKLYISLISHLFVLSDMVVMASAEKNRGNKSNLPPRLPTSSHSLCTTYHLQRIFNEVQECVNEVTALDISHDVRNGLRSLMDSLKWRFVDILAKEWVRGECQLFYHLETWIARWDASSSSTRYLTQFELFQKHMMTTMHKIAVGIEIPASKPSRQKNIPPILTPQISQTFFDATHSFLDGLILLASEDSPIVKRPDLVDGKGSMEMSLHELVDLTDANNRLLVVMPNIARFSETDLPTMITQLKNAFGISFKEEKNTLDAVMDELDETLFNRYIKPRCQVFRTILKEAVITSDINWYKTPVPTIIRPYICKILNSLVEVHAHLCTVAPALVKRILDQIIREVAAEISKACRQVSGFGIGDLLTAIMEVIFLKKSIATYGRDTYIAKAFDDIINKQLKGRHESLTKDPHFDVGYKAIEQAIVRARHTTSLQFLCFRRADDDETGSYIQKGKTRPQKQTNVASEYNLS